MNPSDYDRKTENDYDTFSNSVSAQKLTKRTRENNCVGFKNKILGNL